MLDLGPHAAFIWAAYATVALVIAALLVWLRVDGRRQQRLVEMLELESKRRRAATDAPRSDAS